MTAEEMAEKLVLLEHETQPNASFWVVRVAGGIWDSYNSEGEARDDQKGLRRDIASALRLLLWEALFVPVQGTEMTAHDLDDLEKVSLPSLPAPRYVSLEDYAQGMRSEIRRLLAYVCELLQLLAHARQDNGWEDGRRAGLRQGAEEMRERIIAAIPERFKGGPYDSREAGLTALASIIQSVPLPEQP